MAAGAAGLVGKRPFRGGVGWRGVTGKARIATPAPLSLRRSPPTTRPTARCCAEFLGRRARGRWRGRRRVGPLLPASECAVRGGRQAAELSCDRAALLVAQVGRDSPAMTTSCRLDTDATAVGLVGPI